MWGGVQIKEAGALPLSVADLRKKLRLEDAGENEQLAGALDAAALASEDAQLEGFLQAAAAMIEGPDAHGLAMMRQTWTRTLDAWGADIALPGWPVAGVAEIRFLAPDGAWQVLDHAAAFRLVVGAHPARLVRRFGVSLPPVLSSAGVIEVDYILGRDDAAAVDARLVQVLGMLAGHFHENREATTAAAVRELPLGVSVLLRQLSRAGLS